MKRIALILLALVLSPGLVFAAGTWSAPTPLIVTNGSAFKTWSITVTAASDNATITNYTTTTTDQNFMKGYWLYYVETDPGSTGPTASYDIAINSASGFDIMAGALADRSATVTERAFASLSDIKHSPPIDGPLTIAITNNLATSASVTIKFWLFR